MSSIRITCPACTEMLEVDAESIGQEVECGACFQVFVAEAFEKSSDKSSSRSKSPASKSDDNPKGKLRKRRRDDDDEDGDDEDYDDDDYDPRPARRGGRRRYRHQKSRVVYILLGIFLGTLGVHNFYAGRTGQGIAQLLITIISIPLMCVPFIGFFTIWIPWLWAIIDIITVDRDANGVPMAS